MQTQEAGGRYATEQDVIVFQLIDNGYLFCRFTHLPNYD